MAIVKALEEWKPECNGALHPLQLLTDHKNLDDFCQESYSIRDKQDGPSV